MKQKNQNKYVRRNIPTVSSCLQYRKELLGTYYKYSRKEIWKELMMLISSELFRSKIILVLEQQ